MYCCRVIESGAFSLVGVGGRSDDLSQVIAVARESGGKKSLEKIILSPP